jgi:hypothetical protein
MRTLFLLSILLSVFLSGKAQELKTKKQQDQVFTEIFQVNKKNKQKHGSYLKIHSQNKDTLVKGQFLNDSMVGVWTYFDLRNEPYMKYDRSIDSCLWVSEFACRPDTFPIRVRTNFGFAQLQRPPVFIGPSKEMVFTFISDIKPPMTIILPKRSLIGMISFVVSKSGEIVEVNVDKIDNSEIRLAVKNIFKTHKWKFIPGLYDGNPVDTKLYVVLDVSPIGMSQEVPYKPYVTNIHIQYFGVKTTRSLGTQVMNVPMSDI